MNQIAGQAGGAAWPINWDDGKIGEDWPKHGVTDWESSHHEPLRVALSQEIPDTMPAIDDSDDLWLEVEVDEFPGRLLPDDREAGDDFAVAVVDPEDYACEELAMHIVAT